MGRAFPGTEARTDVPATPQVRAYKKRIRHEISSRYSGIDELCRDFSFRPSNITGPASEEWEQKLKHASCPLLQKEEIRERYLNKNWRFKFVTSMVSMSMTSTLRNPINAWNKNLNQMAEYALKQRSNMNWQGSWVIHNQVLQLQQRESCKCFEETRIPGKKYQNACETCAICV